MSAVIEACQVCDHSPLETVLSLGYMPPVNQMMPVGDVQTVLPWFPTNLLYCSNCDLVQLGIAVDQTTIFPPEYPYTSGTTKALRDNFADLYVECSRMLKLTRDDLCVDIGSNDGTLLSNFQKGGHRVLGVEPTDVAEIAAENGILTYQDYFCPEVAAQIRSEHGPAKVVTAANCFAHIDDVHSIVESILELLAPDGVFISESHYLIGLLDRVQYDTIYHEHLRYYSVSSLKFLLECHDLEVFHARHIPSHGGSIRVYAARRGVRPVLPTVAEMIDSEPYGTGLRQRLAAFRQQVTMSKLRLYNCLYDIKQRGGRIVGISAPSRASTLLNYVGLDADIIEYVCEIEGSLKIGKYMPGTLIPVVEESRLFEDQPECAVILSWHIADELAPKLRAKGYNGLLVDPIQARYI